MPICLDAVMDNVADCRDKFSSWYVTVLWRLSWQTTELSCAIYRTGDTMELRLESAAGVILAEPFEIRPRIMLRVETLRTSLRRRGWQEIP